MNMYVIFTPNGFKNLNIPPPDIAIVLDILRATTTITQALESGATQVLTFSSPEELNEYANQQASNPMFNPIKMGERDGIKLPCFDYGNSPVILSNLDLHNKSILMTTTNGTKAIASCSNARTVVCACLRNRMAISRFIARERYNTLLFVCSGWKNSFSLEDTIGAGAIIDAVMDDYPDAELKNDEALCALTLYQYHSNKNIYQSLCMSSHGKRLLNIGLQKDIEWCSQIDVSNIVPIQKEKGQFERHILV